MGIYTLYYYVSAHSPRFLEILKVLYPPAI